MLSGSINSNLNALYALNSLTSTGNTANNLEQQLSSGLSINSPADNPAGYIAAQGFTTQIGGVEQAISNVNQAVSLVQTATGAVQQQVNLLQQIRTIANQAANAINTPAQLASLQDVVSQLQTQVTTISQQAQFNNQNLLDGTFQGVQFQIGANAGQNINFSFANTGAGNIGVYQSAAASPSVYTTAGSATGGAFDNSGNSFTISASAGGFTAGTVAVSGTAGAANVAVGAATESAQNVAASVNAVTDKTNVSAVANTSVAFTVSTGTLSFTLGNGTTGAQTNAVNISATVTSATASGLSSLVNAINQATSQTGVTASVNSSNQLVLTQAAGDNMSFTGFTGTGGLTAGGVTINSGAATGLVQGLVTMQSSASFALDAGAADIGLQQTSALTSLSAVDVSTVGGANAALNIVDFAIQGLENVGAEAGALQQRLNATVSNLQTSDVNLTAARATVQDANIPAVTTKLTQQQILQQAGVDALSQAGQLQQSFLRLLQ
jgi:flagellin